MLVAELRKRFIQGLSLLKAPLVLLGVVAAGEAFEAVTRQKAFLNRVHASPREAPLFVDEQVVHHATQPRAGLIDGHEVIELAERLDQEFLEQVFGFSLLPGQAIREPVQAVEMRTDQKVESLRAIVDRRSPRSDYVSIISLSGI